VANGARRAIFDIVGVMTAGAMRPAVKCAVNAFGAEAGRCRVVDGKHVPASAAALINGTAAHAWDDDDTSYMGHYARIGRDLCVLIAAAQESNADDAAILTAFVDVEPIVNRRDFIFRLEAE
jgi:2-methylcitrate dehydratase PrpD